MASRTTITLVDDLDGSTADESVLFGLDRAEYEIDLSKPHAGALRDVLAPFVAAARRTGGRRTVAGARRTAGAVTPASGQGSTGGRGRGDTKEIRAWALEHGSTLPARGRLPGAVVEAFDAGDPSTLPGRLPDDAASRVKPKKPTAGPATPSAPEPVVEQALSTGDVEPTEELPRGRDGLTAPERDTIRAWATEQGIEVKGRGQLKKDLIANYQAWARRSS